MTGKLNIVQGFILNLEDIDAIFETSNHLKSLYLNALEKIDESALPYSAKRAKNNSILALNNISFESITQSEKKIGISFIHKV